MLSYSLPSTSLLSRLRAASVTLVALAGLVVPAAGQLPTGPAFVDDQTPPPGDCDGDGIPDDQEPDSDGDGIPDDCDPPGGLDCNKNRQSDELDIRLGISLDCNCDTIPDECQGILYHAGGCGPAVNVVLPGSGVSTPVNTTVHSCPGDGLLESHAATGRRSVVARWRLTGEARTVDDGLRLECGGLVPGRPALLLATNETIAPLGGVFAYDVGLVSRPGFTTVAARTVDARGAVVVDGPADAMPYGFVRPGDAVRFQVLVPDEFFASSSGVASTQFCRVRYD